MTATATSAWAAALTRLHLRALPHSTYVPVDAWLADPLAPSRLLHLQARGTRVRLAVHDASDLTTLLLRAECDCEEHRQAGAAGRPALRPGASPLAEVVYDGAAEAGWTGVAGGRLRRDEVAPLLLDLHARLEQGRRLRAAG